MQERIRLLENGEVLEIEHIMTDPVNWVGEWRTRSAGCGGSHGHRRGRVPAGSERQPSEHAGRARPVLRSKGANDEHDDDIRFRRASRRHGARGVGARDRAPLDRRVRHGSSREDRGHDHAVPLDQSARVDQDRRRPQGDARRSVDSRDDGAERADQRRAGRARAQGGRQGHDLREPAAQRHHAERRQQGGLYVGVVLRTASKLGRTDGKGAGTSNSRPPSRGECLSIDSRALERTRARRACRSAGLAPARKPRRTNGPATPGPQRWIIAASRCFSRSAGACWRSARARPTRRSRYADVSSIASDGTGPHVERVEPAAAERVPRRSSLATLWSWMQ